MSTIKISFTGDCMCSSIQDSAAFRNGVYDYSNVFKNVASILHESDYVVSNLETTISGKDLEYTDSLASFNTPETFLKAIKDAGIRCLTNANNHILDRGKEGIIRTLHALDNYGFDHTGAYLNKTESDNPFIKEIQGVKVAIVSCTYGMNTEFHGTLLQDDDTWMVDLLRAQRPPKAQDSNISIYVKVKSFLGKVCPDFMRQLLGKPTRASLNKPRPTLDNTPSEEVSSKDNFPYMNRVLEKIRLAREKADIVVVCVHVGGQYNSQIGDYAKFVMEKIKGVGGDFIIGNHPHCILPAFLNGNNLYCYSLGNFSFTPGDKWYVDDVFAEYSILLNAYIDVEEKRIVRYTYSVLKNIVNEDGSTRVVPLYDLIDSEVDPKRKDALFNDLKGVSMRFIGKPIFDNKREYRI